MSVGTKMGTVIQSLFGSLRPSSRFAGNEGGCFYKATNLKYGAIRRVTGAKAALKRPASAVRSRLWLPFSINNLKDPQFPSRSQSIIQLQFSRRRRCRSRGPISPAHSVIRLRRMSGRCCACDTAGIMDLQSVQNRLSPLGVKLYTFNPLQAKVDSIPID